MLRRSIEPNQHRLGYSVKLGSCDCGRAHLMALKRPLWVRILFPHRKRYVCLKCGLDQLRPRYWTP